MKIIKSFQYFTTFFFVIILFTTTFSASNCWMRDNDNRAIILHGLNISNAAKRTSNQISWQTFEDYQKMSAEWGFNCIRLLIFWSAIEPEPGVYNDTYLDLVEERVDWAEDLGLYVILDMHQDLYSAKFGGDGAPYWAVRDDGFNFTYMNPWWLNYIQPAVRHAFNNFWTAEDLRSSFINSWVHVAQRFAGSANFIGYEILNEPFFGNFLPRTFEKIYLKDFYLDVIDAIRSVDTNHYIFYEPEIMTSAGFKSFLPKLNSEKLMYAPHFYQTTVHEGLPYLGSEFFIKGTLDKRNTDAENANVPWLLGEFGVQKDLYGMNLYLKNILGILNADTASWTYWAYDYDSQDEFGVINESGWENPQLQLLVYPYPQKIAGDPLFFNYDYASKIFCVEFHENNSVHGPTEISISESRIYANGFSVSCSDPDGTWGWEYSSSHDTILVWTNSTNEIHRIEIRPNLL
jgi:endoglycosylceramidase